MDSTVYEILTAFLVIALTLLAFGLYRWRLSGHEPAASRFDLTVDTIDIEGWKIRYHRSGTGPYLVLLHGIGANLFCWRDLVPLLNSRYTVVALDLPGFGQSSKLRSAKYGLDEQVERLDQLFKSLSIDFCYLVGNSMGGNIALWFALMRPKQVLGLSVIAPATSRTLIPLPLNDWVWLSYLAVPFTNRLTMAWAHQRTVSKRHLVDKLRITETTLTYGRNPLAIQAFLAATAAIRDVRLSQQLAQLQRPVQILWGSRDKLVSRKVIDQLESLLPESESHVHLGGGHHLQEDEPEWVAEKITTFFAALPTNVAGLKA